MMRTEINRFLDNLDLSSKTVFAYRNGLEQFIKAVGEKADLNSETYVKFLISIRNKSASTQRIYTTAVLRFFAFCRAGNWVELKELTRQYTQKSGNRVVNFNRKAVESVVTHCETLGGDLFALRDRAFVLTLVDTGLRISEACSLKCGDIDWQAHHAMLTEADGKQVVVRFSNRSIGALDDYLRARANVEPNSTRPLASQPLFARHDIRASKRIRCVSAGAMWKAIKDRITDAGVDRHTVRIHDLRHYFVTMTYLAKRDLKLSQELARNESISTTHRYANFDREADAAYDEIFNKK